MTHDQLIRTWFAEVWNSGNEAVIDQLMAPDAIAHGLPSENGAPILGPAGFKPFFRTFRNAFPDMRIEVLRTVTEGDTVCAHCRVTGTHHGPGLGPVISGNAIDFKGMAMVRIADGQIREAWNSFDFLSLYQQIGLAPVF